MAFIRSDAMHDVNVAIIGGGLSGLYAAHLLSHMKIDFQLFEARDRLGGRILSTPNSGPRHDLEPSWLWPAFQPRMAALAATLGLQTFAQHTSGAMLIEKSAHEAAKRVCGFESGSPSIRISGGSGQLTQALAASVAPERLMLNARVIGLKLQAPGVSLNIETKQGLREQSFTHVITAMPLRLLAQDFSFEPAMPATTIERWVETPTWMAPHAKYIALYDHPFWREAGLSGMAQSHVGPMVEIHDASDSHGSAALFGFIGLPVTARQSVDEATLLDRCRLQMVRLFGKQAETPQAHYIKDWAADPLTATHRDYDSRQGHFSRGHSKLAQDAWSPHLFVAGTEASVEHNGYMEGALESAESAVEKLRRLTK